MPMVKLSEHVKEELDSLKDIEGHKSYDSVIRSLLFKYGSDADISDFVYEREKRDIRAVYDYIIHNQPATIDEIENEKPGPTSDEQLDQINLTRKQQIGRIVRGLEASDKITRADEGFIQTVA